MWTEEKLRSAFVVTFKSFVLRFYFFPRSLAPSALSSFERICWFGIAFPDSYSWITCGFSLISYRIKTIQWIQLLTKNSKRKRKIQRKMKVHGQVGT